LMDWPTSVLALRAVNTSPPAQGTEKTSEKSARAAGDRRGQTPSGTGPSGKPELDAVQEWHEKRERVV
jgi:hypothetical protein